MDIDALKLPSPDQGRERRRRYDPDWKQRLVVACLQPGASVSRLALEHGVNANLVRKWIKNARQAPVSSTSAFIPVQIEPGSHAFGLETSATHGDSLQPRDKKIRPLSCPAKMSASMPNGVSLTVECSDADGLAAIIGALGHVQTGR